jgi:hypothetical protein
VQLLDTSGVQISAQLDAFRKVWDALIKCLVDVGLPRLELRSGKYMGSATELRKIFEIIRSRMMYVLELQGSRTEDLVSKIFDLLMGTSLNQVPDVRLSQLGDSQVEDLSRSRRNAGIW